MDDGDGDGGLSFDFEGVLDTAASTVVGDAASDSPAADGGGPAPPYGHGRGRGSFRQTVCRHWLRGLCMKGDSCGFLHQYDKERMPVCRFFRLGECREQDCIYKHSGGDIRECNMYRLGFCPNGPNCRYRHVKQPGPPPPVEEVFQRLQQANFFNYGSSNRFNQHRDNNYNQQGEKPQAQQVVVLHNQNSAVSAAPVALQVQTSDPQHVSPPPPPQQQQQNTQVQGGPDGSSNQATRTATPLPHGQSRYFVVKSCNRENLEISVQQGVWATQRSNEAKLNEAFESMENVILIFSINRTRHFQNKSQEVIRRINMELLGDFIDGRDRLAVRRWYLELVVTSVVGIGNAHGTPHYGWDVSLHWLKELNYVKCLCRKHIICGIPTTTIYL